MWGKTGMGLTLHDASRMNTTLRVTWGIFLQNLTPLVGGDKSCGGATECKIEVKENAPPLTGTYIVGADAVDMIGNTARGTSAIYVP